MTTNELKPGTPFEIGAVQALLEGQRQLDMHGEMVGVSRQALEEVLDYLPALTAERDRLAGEVAAMREALQKIEATPAWGHPERFDVTPAEVRQLARAALTNGGNA